MNSVINNFLVSLNDIGQVFWQYSARVFIQSSVLIILILIIDFLLRRHVRAVFRYCVWLLVFVKLILPPSFSLPTGVSYWWGGLSSIETPIVQQAPNVVQHEPTQPSSVEISSTSSLPRGSAKVVPTEVVAGPAGLAEPMVRASVPITWQAILFILWLIGMLVFSVLLIQRVFFVRGLIAQSEPAKDRLVDILNQYRRQIGISRSVELKLSPNIQSPAVCGLLRPTVLMPKALFEKLSPEKLRAVLIHELAHIKRADLWVNLVQTILQVVYFYNPFVWLTNAIVRRIREQAVDEMVLVALGAEAKSYSNTLIDIAEMAFWKANFSLRLIGVVESKKALHRRIKHMLTRPIPKSAKIGIFSLLIIMVMAAVLLPMAAAAKQEKEQQARFIAKLSDDVTIELVGLCEYPSKGKQWWRPDGSELPQEVLVKKRGIVVANGKAYALVVKLDGPDDMAYIWGEIEGSHGRADLHVVDSKGQLIDNMKGLKVYIDERLNETSIDIEIAAGPWRTLVKHDGSGMMSTSGKDWGVTFSRAFESEGGATIIVSDDCLKQNHRIIAIDSDGNVHAWSSRSWGSSGKMRQTTAHFENLKPEQIKEFQFQTRPYQWGTFKNVSLRPGMKTYVRIEEPDKQIDGEQLNVTGLKPVQRSYAAKMDEQDKAKVILRANVFSVNAPISLITDYLRDKLGVNNTTSEMTDAQATQFKKWMETVPETTMISSPSVFVFDGETAEMSVVTNQKEYTVDYEKTSDSPPQYEPVQQKYTTGIELEFTPALTKDNSIIHLNMKFDKNDLVKVEEKKHESGNMIQLPMRNNSEIMTQVAVPVGKYFLVSAGGLYPAKNDSQPDQPAKQIILLVKADVHVGVGGQSDTHQMPAEGDVSGQAKPELLKQIETITDVLIRAFNASDMDTILSYYTDDAMSLPDQHEAAIGKGALHKLQLESWQEGVKIQSIKGLEQQIWDCGNFIFEAGRYMMSVKSPKLRYLLSDWRKSVTVWIRQPDGSLKIKLDSWNPDIIPDANVAAEPEEPVVNVVASGTSSSSSMKAVYEQIRQKESTFHKAFIDHDAEAAIQFYANDAVIMSWGKDAVRGKSNISSDIKQSMSNEPLVNMTQHVVHVEGNNQMLFTVNLFSWTFKDKSSGENVTLPGKGVHVWKRQQDNSWKILLDLYNVSVPVPEN
jgi:beta-lactamase regulating signal transducer with metallopeptidase domain/ketosteroid isomerase-like protein